MKPDLPIFPITEWEVETAPVDELIFVRFTFLSDVRQRLDNADVGNPYVMEVEQVRELRDALTRALECIDNFQRESSFCSHCGEIGKTRS
jgi:biofilm formation regulator BssS-like protein